MLSDFVDIQNIAYRLLSNSIGNNKIFHAYLINGNNFDRSFDFSVALAKSIICSKHKVKFDDECKNCNICSRIDNNNYPELKIITADSMVIKKEQLLELQSEFSRSSIEGFYRVYIIKDCDKMNKQASNSLLKFLEEPVEGIVAILLTNNFSNLLSTIVSRCQVINLVNNFKLSDDSSLVNFAALYFDNSLSRAEFIDNPDSKEFIDNLVNFVLYFENNGLDTLVFIKNMWYNNFKLRDDAIKAFLLMIYFYYDVLKYKIGVDGFFYCDMLNNIKSIADKNSVDSIIYKLDICNYGYEMIKCNLNINLLLDDVVIRLGEYDGNS